MKRAARQQKPIFVQFESATCKQCNEVADQGMQYEGAKTAAARDFIFLKVSPTHPDRAQIERAYNMTGGFGVLFVHHSGLLVHKYNRSSSSKFEYENQMQMARTKMQDLGKSTALEEAYKKGTRDIDFLEQYLLHRQAMDLHTDSLLEEYARLLPPDSLKSIRTLEFIARMEPVLGSKADTALRQPRIFNQAWYGLDLSTRININNRIIYKTLQKAVAEKNAGLALRTALFSWNIHSNREAGERAYKKTLVDYYRQVKDTSAYFESAVAFYTQYYMQVDIDSVKRVDSLSKQRQMEQAVPIDTVKDGRPVQMRAIVFAPAAQRYTNELNEAAWHLYTLTDNLELLSIAAAWVDKGLQFFETPEALHTQAHLLYKLGQPAKAMDKLHRSIALRKERRYPTKDYEAELQKMQAGVPLPK